MKKIKFTLLILLFSKILYSQKICTYHYVLNEHIASNDSIPLLGMEQEFKTTRKHFNPSSFSETRLFTGRNTKSIKYKIKNGVWYYKLRNKWKLFYDYNTMQGGYISFSIQEKYKLQFEKIINIRNDILHKITLEPIGELESNHRPQYYFSPIKGILIIITGSGIILLRKDNFEYSITEEEIDVL